MIRQRWQQFLHASLIALLLMLLWGCGASELSVQLNPARDNSQPAGKVVFLAGPDSHLPGEHEHRAGSALLSEALRQRLPGFETIDVYGGWPADETIFDGADAVVMYCDGGDSHLVNDHLLTFNRLIDAGVGMVALHYCVEVPKESPSAAAMLNAIGGYFETWWSVNPTWTAAYTQLPNHLITEGVQPFSMRDEWYFNMRFTGQGVTPILSALAPASTMKRWNGPHSGNDAVRRMVADGVPQVTAWAYERPGGGRGFGYTGGHFHANWDNADARELVLNAIEWVSVKPTALVTSPD
jgi:type 1 glutamine amidotransferase